MKNSTWRSVIVVDEREGDRYGREEEGEDGEEAPCC